MPALSRRSTSNHSIQNRCDILNWETRFAVGSRSASTRNQRTPKEGGLSPVPYTVRPLRFSNSHCVVEKRMSSGTRVQTASFLFSHNHEYLETNSWRSKLTVVVTARLRIVFSLHQKLLSRIRNPEFVLLLTVQSKNRTDLSRPFV